MNTTIASKNKRPRRTQEERSAAAQEILLKSAVKVVCRNGYCHATMQQIADEAGMTRGAIQHHFNGRVELYGAILKRVENLWTKPFDMLEKDADASVEHKLDVLLDNLLLVAKSPEYRATIEICMNGRSDPEMRKHIYTITQNSTAAFQRAWYETFSPDIPEDLLDEARDIVSAVAQGIVITGIFSAHPERIPKSADLTFARTKEMVKRLVLSDARLKPPVKQPRQAARKASRADI